MTKCITAVLLLVVLGLSALAVAAGSPRGEVDRAWKRVQAQQEQIDRRLKAIQAEADKSLRDLDAKVGRNKGQKRPSGYR